MVLEKQSKAKNEITRCGMCGIWLLNDEVLQPTYFTNMHIAELEKSGKYKLVYCGDCLNEQSQPRGYVTRDMAIDAGDLSLEGQPVY